MSLLVMGEVQCNYWMMDVKLAYHYNSHLGHLTPESWCSYRGEKTIVGNISFLGSQLWEKDVGITSNPKIRSSRQSKQYNLRFVHSAVWLTVYTMLSVGLSASDFSASIISLFAQDEPFGIHHEWGWELSVWKKKIKKYSGQPLTLWLSSNVRWWGTSVQVETCWAEQLWWTSLHVLAALTKIQRC